MPTLYDSEKESLQADRRGRLCIALAMIGSGMIGGQRPEIRGRMSEDRGRKQEKRDKQGERDRL